MSRAIMFSRTFPSYHPRRGEATHFVEKILKSERIGYDTCVHEHSTHSFWSLNRGKEVAVDSFIKINFSDPFDFEPKHHTIRAGHRFKVGDWFSPRVWSGKPYNSKQIIIAPDIQVKKVWDFEVYNRHMGKSDLSFRFSNIDEKQNGYGEVAKNDGLELTDFMHWFNKPFDGQIICWNDQINY